jgi:hypothetical protein
MSEQTPQLIKKIGIGNKSLSVIVADEKLSKFKRFSQGVNLSMGYLLNQAIDRYLSSESTDIFKTSIGFTDNTPKVSITGESDVNIEELVKTTIEDLNIEELIKTTIDKLDLKGIAQTDTPQKDIEKIVRIQVEPLADLITELEACTRSQIDTLRNDLKKPLAIAR